MKHEPEIYGGVIERQAEFHQKAHERAIARNAGDATVVNPNSPKIWPQDSEPEPRVDSGVEPAMRRTQDAPQQTLGFTEAEREGALPCTGPLSWHHGEVTQTPAYIAPEPLPESDRNYQRGLSGVDAIVRSTGGF